MNRVNRAALLQSLQTVQAGLSPKPDLEQSNCFVFRDGEVVTFNDEVACRVKTPLVNGKNKFTGAVVAAPLMKILDSLEVDEIKVEYSEAEFSIISGGERVDIRLEKEITLPIDSAEKPGKVWTPLPENFLDAINTVQECAAPSSVKNSNKFSLTCIHFHPKYIEAFDNEQLARYRVKTPISKEFLVRGQHLKHLIRLEVTEFNETEGWVHFRDHSGLTISYRRYMENYIDLTPIIEFEGEPMQLPPGLAVLASRAEIFSEENADNNKLKVDLRPGKVRVRGIGNSGKYTGVKKLKYNGPELSFLVSPKLLVKIVEKHSECQVTADMMKVKVGKWTYVTSFHKEAEKKDE